MTKINLIFFKLDFSYKKNQVFQQMTDGDSHWNFAFFISLSISSTFFFSFTDLTDQDDHVAMDYMRSCPSPNKLFPESVRRPLREYVTGVCPRVSNSKRLRALDFQVNKK